MPGYIIGRGIMCAKSHVLIGQCSKIALTSRTLFLQHPHQLCIGTDAAYNQAPCLTLSRKITTSASKQAEDAIQSFTPRRAMMYVPGDSLKKIQKVPSLNADCVVLDCEDGVALRRKVHARRTISEQLDQIAFGPTEACVRVNSIQSGFTTEDLKVSLSAQNTPPTIMLPKVEHSSDLEAFEESLSIARQENNISAKFNLVMFVESAVGLLNLKDICQFAAKQHESGSCPYKLDGIVFGSDDFLANIGATRTKDAKEILMARQMVVVVAKAFDLQAIDIVHIDFKDLDDLREQSLEGARMGFTGKQCIHPGQVSVIQQAFTPTSEKIEWAVELIKAFDSHQISGTGAFTFRGSMIDMPLLRQAQNIVQLQARLNM